MQDFICKYWPEALFTLILAIFGGAYKRLSKKVHKELCDQRSLRDGTQALLRNEIIKLYEKYISLGWIPIYAMENILAMYEAYHSLGGNGTITKIVDELRALPSAKPDN